MKDCCGDGQKRTPTRRLSLVAPVGVIAALFSVTLIPAEDSQAPLPAEVTTFVDKNCVGCHRSPTAPAGLDLAALGFNLQDPHSFGRWVRIHDAVRDGAMPPGAKGAGKRPETEAFFIRVPISDLRTPPALKPLNIARF